MATKLNSKANNMRGMGEMTPPASSNVVNSLSNNQQKRPDTNASNQQRTYPGSSNTLQNSQIHGRKIDSPKIHVSEVQDNRPRTSAQHARKFTMQEPATTAVMGYPPRQANKQKQKQPARGLPPSHPKNGNMSATNSAKNTKNLLMNTVGHPGGPPTAPLTNKEIDQRKFDFGSSGPLSKQAKTPHSNMNKQSIKNKITSPSMGMGLPPKNNNQKQVKQPAAALKSALKNNYNTSTSTNQQVKKRNSSQGAHQISRAQASTSTGVSNTPLNQSRGPNKSRIQTAKNRQTGLNQSSYGGLPSQSSRTGRSQNNQSVQLGNTSISAAQSKRGRRTKSENRYSKKLPAAKGKPNQNRDSGDIILSPMSGSLLSAQSLDRKKGEAPHKKSKRSPSGSNGELGQRNRVQKRLTLQNLSASAGFEPSDKGRRNEDGMLSLSSMSSCSAGHINARNQNQTAKDFKSTAGAGESFNKLFGKSYFVDAEQLLQRHMSPSTPTGGRKDHKSLESEQLVSISNPSGLDNTRSAGLRTTSATHRPQGKTKIQNYMKQQQNSSEMIGNRAASQSLEVDDRGSKSGGFLLPQSQLTQAQPQQSRQQNSQQNSNKNNKNQNNLNMLNFLTQKPQQSACNCGGTHDKSCHRHPNNSACDSGKNQSRSFLNLTQKVSTQSQQLHQILQQNQSANSKQEGFDKMIQKNIRRKNKQDAQETLKKFMKETKAIERKEHLTQRNLQIKKQNARAVQDNSRLVRETSNHESRRNKALSIIHTTQPATSKNKIRSKSCIEKIFSPTMKSHQPYHGAVEDPQIDDRKGKSIVLEIKQLKREINDELRKEVHRVDVNPLMGSSSTTRKQPIGLIKGSKSIIDEKNAKAKQERGGVNTSQHELQIDQGRIHKFIIKQKKQRAAKQTKDKTLEYENQARRKENLMNLERFTRGERKPRGPTSHLRNVSAQVTVNFKKGETGLNRSGQFFYPEKNLRPTSISRERVEGLINENDISELGLEGKRFSKNTADYKEDFEKSNAIIDISREFYHKEHVDRHSTAKGSRKAGPASASSHSRETPGARYGSSKSHKREEISNPPRKNLRPTNLNDTNKIGKITPTGSHLRRKPTDIGAAMNRGTISNNKSPAQHPRGSQRTPVNDIYSTLNPVSDEDGIDNRAKFVSIDTDSRPNRSVNVNANNASIEARRSNPESSVSYHGQIKTREKIVAKFGTPNSDRKNSSEVKQLTETEQIVRLHSSALIVQIAMRKYLEAKGFYQRQYERPIRRELVPKELVVDPVTDSNGSPPNMGATSPSMGHMIPSLNLNKLKNKKDEVKDAYGIDNKLSKPETDRSALATGRSVFERNTFQEFQQKFCKKDGSMDEPLASARIALLDDFPEMLAMREEQIKKLEEKHTSNNKKKYNRKEYSPRTFQQKQKEIEIWVTKEQKEVAVRRKSLEDEEFKQNQLLKETATNANQINRILHPEKTEDLTEEYKLSYREKNNGGASSRRGPSTGRLMEQIKTYPNNGEVSGRPRTTSEGNIITTVAPGPGLGHGGVSSSEEKYSSIPSSDKIKDQIKSSEKSKTDDEIAIPEASEIQIKFNTDLVKGQPILKHKDTESSNSAEDLNGCRIPENSKTGSDQISSKELNKLTPAEPADEANKGGQPGRLEAEMSEPSEDEKESQEKLGERLIGINSPSVSDDMVASSRFADPDSRAHSRTLSGATDNNLGLLDRKDDVQDPEKDKPSEVKPTELGGLKRSVNSTDLRTLNDPADNMDQNEKDLLNAIMQVSPYNASDKVGHLSDTFGSLRSPNALTNINNLSDTNEHGEIEQINNELNSGLDLNNLDIHSGEPLSDKARQINPNAFNIKIEDGSQNREQITTNLNEIGKGINVSSPLSDGSIRGIEGGAVSINSSGGEDTGDMTVPLQDVRAKIIEDSNLDLIKEEDQDEGCNLTEEQKAVAEEFTDEVFNMLMHQLSYEFGIMINRNDPAKGLFKQNAGIKTDLFAIEKYIDEIQTEILQSDKKTAFQKAIKEPLNKDAVAQMMQMQDSKTGSFMHFIDNFPQVLHLDLYLTLEKRRKEAREKALEEEKDQPQTETFIAECEHIHNKVLFDCINDSLLQFKPFSKDGKPMPWSRQTKRLKPSDDFTIQEIFEIVKHDLFRAAITQAGLLPRREFIIKGVFDEEIFGEFREKKLVSLLAHEMIENESKWLNYEFEEAQVKVDVGDIILEQLVQEAIGLLSANQQRDLLNESRGQSIQEHASDD